MENIKIKLTRDKYNFRFKQYEGTYFHGEGNIAGLRFLCGRADDQLQNGPVRHVPCPAIPDHCGRDLLCAEFCAVPAAGCSGKEADRQ